MNEKIKNFKKIYTREHRMTLIPKESFQKLRIIGFQREEKENDRDMISFHLFFYLLTVTQGS
jgi:hypothetical protein